VTVVTSVLGLAGTVFSLWIQVIALGTERMTHPEHVIHTRVRPVDVSCSVQLLGVQGGVNKGSAVVLDVFDS
jgi:hypothetical protein